MHHHWVNFDFHSATLTTGIPSLSLGCRRDTNATEPVLSHWFGEAGGRMYIFYASPNLAPRELPEHCCTDGMDVTCKSVDCYLRWSSGARAS